MISDFKKKKRLRVGLVGIYHESNTFLSRTTEWEDFQNGHLMWGEDILHEYRDAHHEIGGVIEVFSKRNEVDLVPIFYGEATPGGVISKHTAEKLLETLKRSLNGASLLDGVIVVPHGAAVSENYSDFDGVWLQMVRDMVGKNIPVVGTIDPHCNLSLAMASAVNTLVAYKTNPHIDQRQTGRAAAEILMGFLDGKFYPTMAVVQTNVAISIEMQHTASSPCLELYNLAKQFTGFTKVLSVSVVLGFPYADVYEMGTSFIVVTDNDQKEAGKLAVQLKDYLEKNHSLFSGKKIDLKELPEKIIQAEKPLLLLDMGDNVGGGSPGDSTYLLWVLENQNLGKGFMCLYDPDAVKDCERLRIGESLMVKVGGKTDKFHGEPITVSAKIKSIVDGKFSENEPRHGGQVSFNMGITAIVETINGNTLMLTSLRIVPFSLQQLLAFDLYPNDFDVIVAKGVHAPLAAYLPVCRSMIRVNTPGITRADIEALQYENRRRPLYPFEHIESNS